MNASASVAENAAQQAASLRRIAIVLRDLPEGTARQLLAGLGPQARARVRHELANLVDVDPMERKRALESFTGSLKRQAARHEDHYRLQDDNYGDRLSGYQAPQAEPVDELNLGSTSTGSYPPQDRFGQSSESVPPSAPAQSILGFLDQVSDEDLMDILGDEHPQTKAVVLASIEPARAARLLPRLGSAQRQDMLSRIGRLQSLPDDMLTDLATSFRKRVEAIQAKKNRNPLQRLIDQNAIDMQSEGLPTQATASGAWDSAQAARHVPASAVAVSPRLQAILSEMPTSQSVSGVRESEPSQDEAANEVARRLRRITRDESASTIETRDQDTDSGDEPNAQAPPVASQAMSTDEVHQALLGLPARQLCEALGRVDTRVAILALCGLPNEVADAAIACLPRSQANQVRKHLMSVGSMEIREIDQAKDEVARAARVVGSASADVNSRTSRSTGQESRQAAA